MNAVVKFDQDKITIDEFVQLYNKLAPDLDKFEALKKQVAAMAAKVDGDDPITLEGYVHAVDYTAPSKSLTCKLSPQQFIKKTKAWEALSVSVTAARKALSEAQITELFEQTQGSRKFRRVR